MGEIARAESAVCEEPAMTHDGVKIIRVQRCKAVYVRTRNTSGEQTRRIITHCTNRHAVRGTRT